MKEKDEQLLLSGIDELQRLAEDYRELEQLMNAPLQFNYPSTIDLNSRVDPYELAETASIQERQRLGLGDQPIIHLRTLLEWEVGLRIFYWELPRNIAGMYAYTDELVAAS